MHANDNSSTKSFTGGQGDALKALDDLAAFCSDDTATVDRHVAVIRAALAASQPVGISADWVLGYLNTDAPEESREAIRNAFAEYAALSGARQPVGNYEVQTENGPLKCSLAVYAEWQKNEEYIERLKAELAACQPVGEPVCNVEGTWLWSKLMDWCKRMGVAPSNHDELFAIAKEAQARYAAPPAQAVDLGPFREAVQEAYENADSGTLTKFSLEELLALIDNQGKKQ